MPAPPARIRSANVPCGTSVDFDLAGEELPLELLVLADVGRDHLPHLARAQQDADAEVVDAGIVADDREVARAARVQRLDQVLGDPAQAEAAHQDRRPVGDERHRLRRRSASTLSMAGL